MVSLKRLENQERWVSAPREELYYRLCKECKEWYHTTHPYLCDTCLEMLAEYFDL